MTSNRGTAAIQPTRSAIDAVPGEPGVRPGVAAGLSIAGSRLAPLAIGWLAYSATQKPLLAGGIVAAYALAAAVVGMLGAAWTRGGDSRGLAVTADVVSIALIAAFAGTYLRGPVFMYVAAALLGVVRGVADQAYQQMSTKVPAGDEAKVKLHPVIPIALGVAGGAAVGWLGAVAVTCIVAVAWLVAAAIAIWQTPGYQPAGAPAVDAPTQEIRVYTPMRRPDTSLRTALGSGVLEGLAIAGAFALVEIWVRDLIATPDAAGLIGGALLAGALATVGGAQRFGHGLLIVGGVSLGFAGGAIPGLLDKHLPISTILIAIVAFGAGAMLIIGAPTRDAVVDYTGAYQERMLGPGLASAVGFVLTAAGVLGGAELTARMRGTGALIAAAACYLIAVGFALVTRPPSADPATGDEIVPLSQRHSGSAVWVAVTMLYADGGWTVEVERKRGKGEGAHPVPAGDALRAVAALDLPGLRTEIEEAIAADQAAAQREVERARAELDGLGQKLSAINEMVDLSDVWRTAR